MGHLVSYLVILMSNCPSVAPLIPKMSQSKSRQGVDSSYLFTEVNGKLVRDSSRNIWQHYDIHKNDWEENKNELLAGLRKQLLFFYRSVMQ